MFLNRRSIKTNARSYGNANETDRGSQESTSCKIYTE